jgi:hypothetical protein
MIVPLDRSHRAAAEADLLPHLPRNPWLRSFVIWTALIALLIVVRLPGASVSPAPCNAHGTGNPDPALPLCGLDDFNADGLVIFLLVVLWFGGIAVEAVAFAVARLANWLRRPRESSPE